MTKIRLSPETAARAKQMRRYVLAAAVLIDAADKEDNPTIKFQFLMAAKAQVEQAHSEQVWVVAARDWMKEATRAPLRRKTDPPPNEKGWWAECLKT